MGRFFPDEQVQEAIDALNQRFPEVWPRIKEILRAPTAHDDPRVLANADAFTLTFAQLPFVARITDARERGIARTNLIVDVMNVARAEFDAESKS
jgi:hypothetical protein